MKASSYRGHEVIKGIAQLAGETLTDFKVYDGPPTKTPYKSFLIIGFDQNSPYHAVASRGESDMTGRNTETGEVACYLATSSGSGNMDAARSAAVDALAAFEAALREDTDGLGGVCDHVEIGDDIALQHHRSGTEGASVSLLFSVAYEAYI